MKKVLTVAASVFAVAAIAVGGTLAYLSANSEEKVNKFTFDNMALTLTEYQIVDGQKQEYDISEAKVITPGSEVSKIPTVSVDANSANCYVYAKVDNGFGEYAVLNIDLGNWEDLGGDLYRYKGGDNNGIVAKSAQATELPAIFSTVHFSDQITAETVESNSLNNKAISIKAYAHQSDNLENVTIANEAAQAYFAG